MPIEHVPPRLPRLRLRPPARRLRGHAAAALVALVALLLPAAPVVAQAAGEPVQAQPKLAQIEIQAGMHVIRAEVAADTSTRMRGLMMRERLGPNEGMLFVFQEKAGHCFWMKNTLIALSIAFVEDDGSIVNIADMKPLVEDSHCPARPVRYALEMEQGWFAKRGIKTGSVLVQPQVFKAPARN
jgi:uncharacterized membrane protein (UPF0127 family)